MNKARAFSIVAGPDSKVDAIATMPEQAESALVLAHGAGAGMTHTFMAAVANGLAARRIACLRYQFPYMQAGRRRVDSAATAHETVRAAVAAATDLWPDVPVFAGGKSYGGRMTSQGQASQPLAGVEGLIFLGFPLHPAGKPSVERAAHLYEVDIPMLFVRGSHDALSDLRLFDVVLLGLGPLASRVDLPEADHGFHISKRTGRTDAEGLDDALDAVAVWTQAWRLHPAASA
jgi:predicted alpha/beta-hydrolase family hydrolase